jgi:hypothetical protein
MNNNKTKKTKPDTAMSDKNAGSGAFNQGSKKDKSLETIITISDEEKRTGHRPLVSRAKKS